MGCCPSRFYTTTEPLIHGDDVFSDDNNTVSTHVKPPFRTVNNIDPFSDANNHVLTRTITKFRMIDAPTSEDYQLKTVAYRIAECPSSVLNESKWWEMVNAYYAMCHCTINDRYRYQYTDDNYMLLRANCILIIDVKTKFDLYNTFNFMNSYGKIIS
jgi:hypothetical protein